jgi:hypothetical protein
MVCSEACAGALADGERALQAILRQGAQSARASAFYCYVSGGLSAAAAVVAWFMLPSPFLILFTAGCGLVLIASGIWHGRAARKQILKSKAQRHPSREATVPKATPIPWRV